MVPQGAAISREEKKVENKEVRILVVDDEPMMADSSAAELHRGRLLGRHRCHRCGRNRTFRSRWTSPGDLRSATAGHGRPRSDASHERRATNN